MLPADIRSAVMGIADDWQRDRSNGGDGKEYANEILRVLTPLAEREEIPRDYAVSVLFAMARHVNGDPDALAAVLDGG